MARKGWEGRHFNSEAERFVGFKTLGFQALPELWTFQSVVGFVLAAFWESRTGLPTSSSIRLVWRLPLQT